MLPTITNVLHVDIALGDVIHYELTYTGSMQDIQNSRDCNHTVVWKLNVQTHFLTSSYTGMVHATNFYECVTCGYCTWIYNSQQAHIHRKHARYKK